MVDLPALFMAWKGVQNDSGIYWSHTEDGTSWAPQRRVVGVGTSHTPSLIFFHSRLGAPVDALFMVWKGARNDSGIYWSHTARGLEPQDWAPQQRVPNVGASRVPSLADLRDRLYMVWKGVEDDPGIYWAQNTGVPGGTFGLGLRIHDVGTSRGPRLSPLSTFGPFFLHGRGANGQKLWMAWKGVEGDRTIYWSSADRFWDWAPQKKVVGSDGLAPGTSEGAALAFFAPVAARTPSLDPSEGMEVTQAIQKIDQSIELIAEKKTVVRVYLGN